CSGIYLQTTAVQCQPKHHSFRQYRWSISSLLFVSSATSANSRAITITNQRPSCKKSFLVYPINGAVKTQNSTP
ncbi:hypothetical protein CCMA1212_006214, partial [Trichoderma ghanense]